MRTGGVSTSPYDSLNLGAHVGDDAERVQRNRALLAAAVGVPPAALVHPEQVHGSGVAVVDGPVDGAVPGVDALVTAVPGIVLAVLAADCLPVLLADPAAGVVAVAHAGRAGLASGVLQETLSAMAGLGATAEGTTAVIGPAACGRCYEVPDELAASVEELVPGSRATTRTGTASIDLLAGAQAVLRRTGVGQVEAVGGCTLEQPARFFSYRRDGLTGRHAGVVGRS
jgi:YfiH family protein